MRFEIETNSHGHKRALITPSHENGSFIVMTTEGLERVVWSIGLAGLAEDIIDRLQEGSIYPYSLFDMADSGVLTPADAFVPVVPDNSDYATDVLTEIRDFQEVQPVNTNY